MVFGTAAITGCVVFLVFLNFTHDRTKKQQPAAGETAASKTTRWER